MKTWVGERLQIAGGEGHGPLTCYAEDGRTYELTRVRLGDGWETTVYLVRHPLATTSVRVVCFPETQRLDHWCVANDHPEAIVAGFFLRDPYRPLGEVRHRRPARRARAGGAALGSGARRASTSTAPCASRRRRELGDDPQGDLAPGRAAAGRSGTFPDRRRGPRGVLGRLRAVRLRHHRRPLSALRRRVSETELLAVCCDGRRSGVDGGLDPRRAGSAPDLLRRGLGAQPRRRRLGHPRAPRAPAEQALLRAGPAGAGVAADRDRAAVRSGRRSPQ